MGFRARGYTPSLLGEYMMWGSNRRAGFKFCSFSSQSASFSLDAFKPSIVFQSTAEGVDLRHLTTL
jgi:hypothetical protein